MITSIMKSVPQHNLNNKNKACYTNMKETISTSSSSSIAKTQHKKPLPPPKYITLKEEKEMKFIEEIKNRGNPCISGDLNSGEAEPNRPMIRKNLDEYFKLAKMREEVDYNKIKLNEMNKALIEKYKIEKALGLEKYKESKIHTLIKKDPRYHDKLDCNKAYQVPKFD